MATTDTQTPLSTLRRRTNRRLGKPTRSPIDKGILDRWRALTTDERADEMFLRARGIDPETARALAMEGNARKLRKSQVAKGGAGSGPQSGGGISAKTHLAAAGRHLERAKEARASGDHDNAAKHLGLAHARMSKAMGVRGEAMDKAAAGNKPLGAAFSHARAVTDKNGGGKKKQKELANAYLRRQGHAPIGKQAVAKKSYAEAYASAAKAVLPPEMHQTVHLKARASAGGSSARLANRGRKDDKSAAMLRRAQKLKARADKMVAAVDKSGPTLSELEPGGVGGFSPSPPLGLIGNSAKKRRKLKKSAERVEKRDSTSDAIESTENALIDGAFASEVSKAEWDESLHPRDDAGKFGESGGAGGGSESSGGGSESSGGANIHANALTAAANSSDVGSGPGETGANGKPFGAMSTREHFTEATKRVAQANKAQASGKTSKEKEHQAAAEAHLAAAKKGLANTKVASSDEIEASRHAGRLAFEKGGRKALNEHRAQLPSHIRDANESINSRIGQQERRQKSADMVSKSHVVAQLGNQLIDAAYGHQAERIGEGGYLDPPSYAHYLDAQRLVAGMDLEMSNGAETTSQARARASSNLSANMGAYDRAWNNGDRAIQSVGGLNLDLGSGAARERGFLGLDVYPYDYGTIIHDLAIGIPFADGSARAVRLTNALDDMPDYSADATPLMQEVQRVLTMGGRFYYSGTPIQDRVDWSKLPGLGVAEAEFGPGGTTQRVVLQRVSAKLPVCHGADINYLSVDERSPADLSMALATFGDMPAADVAMANLVHKREHVELKARVLKREDWQQLVLGVVLSPEEIDSQGDVISAEEIEKTAHQFMVDARVVGKEHTDVMDGGQVVESYIAPVDMTFSDGQYGQQVVRKGSWVLGVRVPDSEWPSVLAGKFTGFSVGGWGEREDVAS